MKRDAKQVLTEYLVLSAQGGDDNAFRELHRLWNADFRRMGYVRVRDETAVDEIVNDTWLAIARGLRGLDDPATFPAWAFRILLRRSVDWIRRRAAERRRDEIARGASDELSPAPLGAGTYTESAAVEHIRGAIAALPDDQRLLLHLYYDASRSVGEIAAALEVPAGTIKSRLFAVRELLRHKLEKIKIHE